MPTAQRKLLASGLIAATLTLTAGAGQAVSQPDTTGQDIVHTDNGAVRGTIQSGIRKFENIPYAAPPVGKLRWQSPRPVRPWQGVLDGTKPGNICPQVPGGYRLGTESEDCLNLAVSTETSATPRKPKPVMVMLDTGGFVNSSNVGTDYRRMVTQGDVVMVQPNLRVGPFGYFAHPAMRNNPDAGSYTVRDQQAALRWVQRNIHAFGGDPDNVTIFGESGGSMSTCANLVSPGSKGLFDKAIMQSGPCDTDFQGYTGKDPIPPFEFHRSLQDTEQAGASLAADLGCTDRKTAMACLRSKPISAFQTRFSEFGRPTYGNAVLPIEPGKAVRAGKFNRVPLMFGANSDEQATYLAPIFPKDLSVQAYRKILAGSDGDPRQVFAKYPPRNYGGSPGQALSAAHTDRFWALRTRQNQRAFAKHIPVYAYEFADRTAPVDPDLLLPPQEQTAIRYGAYHGADFQYLLDIEGSKTPFNQEQTRLARQMVSYWTGFAHRGDPNRKGLPTWSRFDNADRVPFTQRLTTDSQGGTRPMDYAAAHKLGFWNQVSPPGK